jgi:hypothetical protein
MPGGNREVSSPLTQRSAHPQIATKPVKHGSFS